jgi:hypothetical protein
MRIIYFNEDLTYTGSSFHGQQKQHNWYKMEVK